MARITTRPYRTGHAVSLVDWEASGLRAPSVIRLHQLATFERALIVGVLGRLPSDEYRRIASILRQTSGADT